MNPVHLARRHFGIAASFVFSLANFAVLLLLQAQATPAEFGLFALAQVFVQFGIGLVNAMASAPMVVLAARAESEWRKAEMAASFAKASFVFCLAGAFVVATLVMAAGGDPSFALLIAGLAALNWFRWHVRSTELALEDYLRPALADLLYGAVVLTGLVVVLAGVGLGVMSAALLQVLGCAAAILVVGPATRAILRATPAASWQPFREGLQQHGRWTLLGVATTEATANAHAYLIGFFMGPAAFAPIAAVTLFFRPVTIVTQALTQYERPRMAKSLQHGGGLALGQQVRYFGLLSLAMWAVNTAAVLTLVWALSGVIGNDEYSTSELQLSAILLSVVFLFRAVRGGPSAVLQAAGLFRPLAMASLVAAPITVFGAFAVSALFDFNAVWSLLGVLAGEAVLCIMILAMFRSQAWVRQ